jgi:hypothetical protein
MREQGSADPVWSGSEPVLQGPSPGYDRPSWFAVIVVVIIAVSVGFGFGYSVANSEGPAPTPAPVTTPSPTPLKSVAADAFIPGPCQHVGNVPFEAGSIRVTGSVGSSEALPGTQSCTLYGNGGPVASISVRQVPTRADELAVIVDELFQGDDVSEASLGDRPAFLIPCPHFWSTCHAAMAVVREPYFVVVALEAGAGDETALSALAEAIIRYGFP